MGIGIILLVVGFPVWLGVLLGICFAVVYIGKRLFKLQKEEIAEPKGTLLPLTLATWGIDIGAVILSFIFVLTVTYNMPFFSGIHSEWGLAAENAYFPAAVYLFWWAALYAAMMLPAYFVFKRYISDSRKRNRMFWTFIGSSAVIWFVLMCLLYLR